MSVTRDLPDPSTTPGRRLVLCLDGTWNSTANEHQREDNSKVLRPTNTLKICRAVTPVADRQQITYYDIGVGSLAEYPGIANRLLWRADQVLGGAWGAGFEGNVEDALHFLVVNHQPGDDVFIFGFSRGAATARAVTRFLEWSGGLLPKKDAYYLPFFFRAYVESHGEPARKDELLAQINGRRASSGRRTVTFEPVRVKFLGVWDTVASLGSRFQARGETTSPAGRSFHTGKAPVKCVEHARQALAIDEKRFDFRPEVWVETNPGQKMSQRWFAGAHSNVGGGLKTDGLANLALRWILHGAEEEGLHVDSEFLEPFRAVPTADIYDSWTTKFKAIEAVRLRLGKGKRPIHGANADLHDSVLDRIRALRDYRPDNVLDYLAQKTEAELAAYGDLPPDVRSSIERRRPNTQSAMAAV